MRGLQEWPLVLIFDAGPRLILVGFVLQGPLSLYVLLHWRVPISGPMHFPLGLLTTRNLWGLCGIYWGLYDFCMAYLATQSAAHKRLSAFYPHSTLLGMTMDRAALLASLA